MKEEEAKELLRRFQSGSISEAEERLLERWMLDYRAAEGSGLSDQDILDSHGRVWARVQPQQQPTKRNLWHRVAATSMAWKVAAAVAVITLGIWLFYSTQYLVFSTKTGSAQYANDVMPGRNTATLTLADGKVINLSDQKVGVIIDASKLTYNDGTAITARAELDSVSLRDEVKQSHKDGKNEIATARAELGSVSRSTSRNDGQGADGRAQTLTMSTPRGGTYQVILPDGSKVWLNAASSIKFPSSFKGAKHRSITLVGEAYFEIFKNKNQKFVVTTKNQQVEVLGTHFNINSYADEGSTKTTLLEGSVRVFAVSSNAKTKGVDPSELGMTKKGEAIVLKPNQQSSLEGSTLKVLAIDPKEILAWKNGEFVFNDEPLEDIMRRVARWYDVDVLYKDIDKTKRFNGAISRFENISKVLDILQTTGKVKFKIEGRSVYVSQ